MKSFFDTLPSEPEGSSSGVAAYWVIICPIDGKLPKGFKPVLVEPWQPEPRRERGRAKRPVTVERVEKINGALRWDQPDPQRTGTVHLGEAGTDEPLEVEHTVGHVDDDRFEADEYDDWRHYQAAEAQGIRSLMQPAISSADWSWRAPAARCRSCGAVTWIASIADGIRCLRNAHHRKGCTCPPSRLEVELTCAT